MGNAALKAAAQGHRFIMTPARLMYFIRYQGPQWFEPLTYFPGGSLKDVYEYEPVQKSWPAEYEALLMGVQACMWTEFCSSPHDVEHQLFPRLTALAEVAWCQKDSKSWPEYLARLDAFLPRLDEQGIHYARSMYNIQQTVTPVDGSLQVSLECIRPDVAIRYTTDGSEPTAASKLYDGPFTLGHDVANVKCATFSAGKRMGEILELPLKWNKATAKNIVNATPAERLLVNGLHGSLKQTDMEWCTWADCSHVGVTLDLGAAELLNNITLGFINNFGMAVHRPASLAVTISDDNITFSTVGERTFTPEEIYLEGSCRIDERFDLGGRTARYVRIEFKGPAPCPDYHARPDKIVQVYMDEITIE